MERIKGICMFGQRMLGKEEVMKLLARRSDKDRVIAYSDNCPGQTKNWVIMALWLMLVRTTKFKTIEHKFLISGHTHLPSDRDFASIENRQRKYAQQVFSPDEWKLLMRDCIISLK